MRGSPGEQGCNGFYTFDFVADETVVVAAVQVLLLWDRLLGYDSLELLPVLAAAVLVFRAGLIMQVLITWPLP